MKLLIVTLSLALLCGCAEKPKEPATPATRYDLEGVVKSLDPNDPVAVIDAKEIKGWLPLRFSQRISYD